MYPSINFGLNESLGVKTYILDSSLFGSILENLVWDSSKLKSVELYPLLSCKTLVSKSVFDELTNIGKRFGFDSSIVDDFFYDYESYLNPILSEKPKFLTTSGNLPSFVNLFGFEFVKSNKIICLFKRYIIDKLNKKKILFVVSKRTELLHEIESFEYFKSKLN